MNRFFASVFAAWCINASALDFKGIVVGEVFTPEKVESAIAGKCRQTWTPKEFVCSSSIEFDANQASVVVIIRKKGIIDRIDLFLDGNREQAYQGMLTRLGKPTLVSTNSDVDIRDKPRTWIVNSWDLGGNVRASIRWNTTQPKKSFIYYNTKEEGDRMGGNR